MKVGVNWPTPIGLLESPVWLIWLLLLLSQRLKEGAFDAPKHFAAGILKVAASDAGASDSQQ
jgi:hypothetical protein